MGLNRLYTGPRATFKISYERCGDTGHERRLLFIHGQRFIFTLDWIQQKYIFVQYVKFDSLPASDRIYKKYTTIYVA